MTAAMPMRATQDQTDLPTLVRGGVTLGLIQSALVAAFAVLEVKLEGVMELVVCGPILLAGVAATIVLPGRWTRARTIEGIAGAAGIGLAAAGIFLLVDVALLQPIGTYTNRWAQIGGFSNWWYHPVWWMVGPFLPWMGSWILAHQADKGRRPSIVSMMAGALVCTAVVGIAAVLLHFPPGARWNLPTFGIAFLPGLALATLLSGMGRRGG